MRILISGSSGLIGQTLAKELTQKGHEVLPLKRTARSPGDLHWDPYCGLIDSLPEIDAAIHLSGENLMGWPWNQAKRRRIFDSRILTTRFLAQSLAALAQPPRVLICASAIGYYGSRPGQTLDERSGPGQGFLATLCQEWEDATRPVQIAGTRVVNLRFEIILSREGGSLPLMRLPFRFGLGARLGNGQQTMSWIAIEDVVSAIVFILGQPDLQGPLNLTAPNPVSNADFTRLLARTTCFPALLRVPAFGLHLMFGLLADEMLLSDIRALPEKLTGAGFRFHFTELESYLQTHFGTGAATKLPA